MTKVYNTDTALSVILLPLVAVILVAVTATFDSNFFQEKFVGSEKVITQEGVARKDIYERRMGIAPLAWTYQREVVHPAVHTEGR